MTMAEARTRHEPDSGGAVVVRAGDEFRSEFELVVDAPGGATSVVGFDEVAIHERRFELFVHHHTPAGRVAVRSGSIDRDDLGDVGAWLLEHGRRD